MFSITQMGGLMSMTTHDKQRENHAKDQDDNKPNHGKSRKKGK